jgi:uncharacterized membrane protein
MNMNDSAKKIFRYIIYFIIFSFLGSLMEYSSSFIGGKGIYYDQGLYIWFGKEIPFIPLYGLGGVTLILLQNYLSQKNVNRIFFGLVNGAVITAIEFLSGFFSLIVFKRIFWSYSHQLLNFRGIISLPMFLTWILVGYIFSLVYFLIIKKLED